MVERISISLESELLERFDALIGGEGYATRSEAIRDLIRDALVQQEWAKGTKTTMGVAVLVYDHHTRELSQKLTHLQHHQAGCIIGSLHVHMDAHNCLEVIILKGPAKKIQHIAASLISAKGVKHGRFVGTTTGADVP